MQNMIERDTPYALIGGTPAVAAIVDRFYDLIETDPDYGELRALHAGDLVPVRRSLTEFLTVWLGGPRDWFEREPRICIMSAHDAVAITPATTQQWNSAMRRAIGDCGVPEDIGAKMSQVLASMATAMQVRLQH